LVPPSFIVFELQVRFKRTNRRTSKTRNAAY